jgi:hypothetical protein
MYKQWYQHQHRYCPACIRCDSDIYVYINMHTNTNTHTHTHTHTLLLPDTHTYSQTHTHTHQIVRTGYTLPVLTRFPKIQPRAGKLTKSAEALAMPAFHPLRSRPNTERRARTPFKRRCVHVHGITNMNNNSVCNTSICVLGLCDSHVSDCGVLVDLEEWNATWMIESAKWRRGASCVCVCM